MKELRRLLATSSHNDGTRTLKQSILVPELVAALEDWAAGFGTGGVLIGGLAFSAHAKPRQTQDVDFLVLTGRLPDNVPKFRRTRPHGYTHEKTHVEVEALEPSTIGMSLALAIWVGKNSRVDSSLGFDVRVASPSAIVASKLGRWSLRDRADADELMQNFAVDLSTAPLSSQERSKFADFFRERDRDRRKT